MSQGVVYGLFLGLVDLRLRIDLLRLEFFIVDDGKRNLLICREYLLLDRRRIDIFGLSIFLFLRKR